MARQVPIVVSGDAAGTRLDAQGEVILGREGEGGPALGEDPKLSRRHARLTRDAGGALAVEDLNSMNGTFVNGERIVGPRVLSAGDLVRVGNTTVEVRLEDDDAAIRAPSSFAEEERTQTTDELPLPVEQVGSPTAVRPLLRSSRVAPPATLLHEGKRLPILPHGLTIGRLQESDLVISSELTSRSHARVVPAEGRYFVADLGSINGTYLNGERLLGEARWLNPGDTIAVGGETIRFLTGLETYAGGVPALEPGVQAARFDGRRLTMGRDHSNDVHLEAPSISRFHAEIVATDGVVELRDLGSRNGTRVDGELVSRAAVRAGSEIGIGPFRLIFDGSAFLQRDDRGALRLDAYDIAVAVRAKVILDRTSISVQPGEFVALIGESGSGKTTLIRVLAGVSKPSDGMVLLNGEPVKSRLADLGYLPQDEIVHPRLSVLESLRYSARLRLPPDSSTADIEDAVSRVLAETGLEEQSRTRIGSLSGGQRKRVGLATELLNRPGLLFLDEPTTGLDPGLETRMMELFRSLAAVGSHALLLVTHATRNLELVDRLCVLARGGQMCFLGRPDEAKEFFGVGSFDDIYTALDTRPIEQWRRAFETDRAAPSAPVDAVRAPSGRVPRTRKPEVARVRRLQARVLASRYLRVFLRDRRNVLTLLLQAPLLALAMALLFKPYVFAPPGQGLPSSAAQLLFILVVATIWLGTITSAREIIKERGVFSRERAIGVRVDAYLASKLAVLAPLVTIQTGVLVLVVFQLRPLHGSATTYAALLVALALTGLVAVAMGLLISALVRTEEQAMAFIPVAMIVQLLFGGAIVTVQSMGSVMATLSTLVFSRWAFGGAGQIAQMNERIAGDQVFSGQSPYDPSFFDVPFPATLVILGTFFAVLVGLTAALLRQRRE